MFKEFPRLNGLKKITVETSMLKLLEEAGELSQAVSKFRGLNGERDVLPEEEILDKTIEELFDVMQVSATLAYLIEEKYNIDLEHYIELHVKKLKEKGYLIEEN